MYVCLCKGITDSQIRDAIADGKTNYRELRMALGLSTQCGRCAVHAREIFREETQGVHDSSLYYSLGKPDLAAARAVA
jgi:bacterioferritin-associated ferredoxin